MGFAARTSSALDLNLAPVIWKRLLKLQTGLDDLRDFDQFTYQMLTELQDQAKIYSEEDFNAAII
jgi:hypothetical protein